MATATSYPTVAAAEEQHLAAMSASAANMSSTASSVKATKVKTTKKVSSKKASTAAIATIEMSQGTNKTNSQLSTAITDSQQQQPQKQQKQRVSQGVAVQAAEEGIISSNESSTMTATTTTNTVTMVQQKSKIVKKKASSTSSTSVSNVEHENAMKMLSEEQTSTVPSTSTAATKTQATTTNGKKKSKKSKKAEAEKENISVRSSFSKFDALQKKNLIHVRSSDAGKAQEVFSEPQSQKERNCRLCSKPVYKMEEIKAEKSIYHKSCFRCQECDKQLKVDNYQSHEGILYCMVHFKLLFAPKFVEESTQEKPRKPELIIRENQPVELPPDVVRASDKPDLGLEELSQLNVRSKFQVFENGIQEKAASNIERNASTTSVKRSTSILSKLAKLQSRGFITGLSVEHLHGENGARRDGENSDADDNASSTSDGTDSDGDGSNSDDSGDTGLVRSQKRTQRERPVGLGNAMNDIKTKFEKGHLMTKEERREERKQEIQSIRSRLFMGKQARIKEMYQQAVAESEQGMTSVGKKPEIDIGDKARSLKERFEKGDLFKDYNANSDDEGGAAASPRSGGIQADEADVFESAISKQSRTIFMELDANAAADKTQNENMKPEPKHYQGIQRNRSAVINRFSESEQENSSTFQQQQENVVKHDERPEDVKIETSEISSKFKFFETYRPQELQKKEFRITPPRDGVVKLHDTEADQNGEAASERKGLRADNEIMEKTHTTSVMLNKFREMEQKKHLAETGPRPLKCFTPPPDGGQRLYQDQDSEAGSEEYDEDGDDDESIEEDDDDRLLCSKSLLKDEALREAQTAARAKQLRAKFEQWEATEIQREMNGGQVNVYSDQVSDDTTIESTKSIRERFENMKNAEKMEQAQARPRYQVNRFV